MTIKTTQFSYDGGAISPVPPQLGASSTLLLAFGARELMADPSFSTKLRKLFPDTIICGCSSAGEILGECVSDGTVAITVVAFEKTRIRSAEQRISHPSDSNQAGVALAQNLIAPNLVHVFVLSEGLSIDGSALLNGISSVLPKGVAITGGLAADGNAFKETFVLSDKESGSRLITAIGFYSDSLAVGYGSLGGWDSFGPERVVTRAEKNVLYELDGQSALTLYKRYLGAYADQLPASGLLFPLALRVPDQREPLVRTILAVDEANQSITFAGDIPTNSMVRLMKANVERLVDGATDAAGIARVSLGDMQPELAILISCVGRKLVLKQRVEDEVESAARVLGREAVLTGFYSYGEIAPFVRDAKCQLHNQTMTITAFRET